VYYAGRTQTPQRLRSDGQADVIPEAGQEAEHKKGRIHSRDRAPRDRRSGCAAGLPITPEHLQSTASDYAEKEGRKESNRHKTANHIFHSTTLTALRMGAYAVFQNLLAS
jgi:hypothetical protein